MRCPEAGAKWRRAPAAPNNDGRMNFILALISSSDSRNGVPRLRAIETIVLAGMRADGPIVGRGGRHHRKPGLRIARCDKFPIVAVNHGGGVAKLPSHAPSVSHLRNAIAGIGVAQSVVLPFHPGGRSGLPLCSGDRGGVPRPHHALPASVWRQPAAWVSHIGTIRRPILDLETIFEWFRRWGRIGLAQGGCRNGRADDGRAAQNMSFLRCVWRPSSVMISRATPLRGCAQDAGPCNLRSQREDARE